MDAEDDFALSGDPLMYSAKEPSAHEPPRLATKGALFIDIETVPDYEREHLFGLPELPPLNSQGEPDELPPTDQILAGTTESIKLTVSGKIPSDEAIHKAIEAEQLGRARKGVIEIFTKLLDAKYDIQKQHEARQKLLSTTPEFCRVAAMCLQFNSEEPVVFVAGEEAPGYRDRVGEEDMLRCFWHCAQQAEVIVGYNHIGFDLPVIFARSAITGVMPTRTIDLSPWGRDVIDVYLRRFGPRGNTSRERPGTLKELARLYGIQIPADGMDGSQVLGLMQTPEGRRDVAKYVRSDVSILHELFLILSGYFWK